MSIYEHHDPIVADALSRLVGALTDLYEEGYTTGHNGTPICSTNGVHEIEIRLDKKLAAYYYEVDAP